MNSIVLTYIGIIFGVLFLISAIIFFIIGIKNCKKKEKDYILIGIYFDISVVLFIIASGFICMVMNI